ncbi:MAG: hypothetical protein K2H50_06325, partial [Paramuribaculum sp.]|nr:hypothetical protein [Paramuribaculum sp.]
HRSGCGNPTAVSLLPSSPSRLSDSSELSESSEFFRIFRIFRDTPKGAHLLILVKYKGGGKIM